MSQRKLPAVFMRGGTSKAVVLHARDLPANRDEWAPIFLSFMGSPDPSMRQLDGMGGGVSSLSKVCVIGPPSRPDADIDYTFAQVRIERAHVDYGGNCGNMSSAMGPFAVDEGLVPRPKGGQAVVRIHNTNTKKIIVSRFIMDGEEAAVSGDMAIDGVAGTGSPIRLEFLSPGGARTGKLLPTGRATDRLDVAGHGRIPASLVDAANPVCYVPAEAVGATGTENPSEIEANAQLMAKLEAVRRAASVAMGIAPDLETAGTISGPGIAFVAPPVAMTTLSGGRSPPPTWTSPCALSRTASHTARRRSLALSACRSRRASTALSPTLWRLGLRPMPRRFGSGIRQDGSSSMPRSQQVRTAPSPSPSMPLCTALHADYSRDVCFIERCKISALGDHQGDQKHLPA